MKWLAFWLGLIKCTISAINGQQGADRFGSLRRVDGCNRPKSDVTFDIIFESAMPTLITEIKQAIFNIREFQSIVKPENREMPAFSRFSKFKDWYYDPEHDVFGPGKFIGYRHTSVANYTGSGKGGRTHTVLSHFFDRLDEDSADYKKLNVKLNAFSGKVGKNISVKLITMGGIYVPKDYMLAKLKPISTGQVAQVTNPIPLAEDSSDDEFEADSLAEQGIAGRTDIDATVKEQLVKSRRGQGKFRINVHRNESCCRITKVHDLRHLRASHIKPWRDCTDIEKLDGCNGLLLAPHIDHLFDRGFISFEDNGDLLISKNLDKSVLSAWVIAFPFNVGCFKSNQTGFLEYHRKNVFKKQVI